MTGPKGIGKLTTTSDRQGVIPRGAAGMVVASTAVSTYESPAEVGGDSVPIQWYFALLLPKSSERGVSILVQKRNRSDQTNAAWSMNACWMSPVFRARRRPHSSLSFGASPPPDSPSRSSFPSSPVAAADSSKVAGGALSFGCVLSLRSSTPSLSALSVTGILVSRRCQVPSLSSLCAKRCSRSVSFMVHLRRW